MTVSMSSPTGFDPAYGARHMVAGTPDWNQCPYHPRGTWERALAFMSQGFHPEPADLKALQEWQKLSHAQRVGYMSQQRRQRIHIAWYAWQVLQPGEVLVSRKLAQRIAQLDGAPGYHAVEQTLRSFTPMTLGGNFTYGNNNPNQRQVHRMYVSYAGIQGHYFSRTAQALEEYRVESMRLIRQSRRRSASHALKRRQTPRNHFGRFTRSNV